MSEALGTPSTSVRTRPGGALARPQLATPVRAIAAAGWLPPLLFGLGLIVRLVVWLGNRGYEPFGDEQYYFRAAVAFAQTGRYSDPFTPAWLPVQRVPLLSLLTGGLFRLTGIDLGPVNLVQIGLSLGIAWFAWRWATLLWGRTAGLWALAIAAFYPTLITHPAAFLYTETLYTFLAALALYLLGRLGAARPAGAVATAWPALTRSMLLMAGLAGIATGLAALTRSAGIGLLGVALLWLALAGWRTPRRAAGLALAVLVGGALTIAPWTLRNYQTYGGLLLLDTVGAYNVWRDNPLPGEKPAEVISAIANPVEQQRVAMARGLHSLRSRPDIFLAKLPATALYLWHLELDSYARGGGYFMDLTNRNDSFPAVLAADLAHLAVSGLALLGLALAPWRRERSPAQTRLQLLLLLWIAVNLISGIVLHSESRFRIPYQPQLIVFGALPLVAWPALWARARRPAWRGLLAVGLLLWLLAGAWSPRLLPALHMHAWVTAGDLAARWQPAAALAAYERAVAAFPDSDRPLVILGDAYHAAGDPARAADAYARALVIQPYNVAAAGPLAHLQAQAGRPDEARRTLRAAGASDADLLSWAWRRYTPAPAAAVDLGSGLEFGYVANVYPPERGEQTDFRWTNGNGLLRLTVPPSGASRLTLRLNGTRLSSARPPAQVEVVVDGQTVERFTADGAWQTRTLDLRPLGLRPGARLLIEVRSDTFVPSSVVAGNRDHRTLGVALDRVGLE